MGKRLKNENSSPRNGKYNHKSGWLAGMFHVFDFHHWRTKNRPICWKTPRTHSLVHEIEEQEPFLDSKDGNSKMLSVVADNKPVREETHLEKMTMTTTKQVTEYVDFLEILRKEDVYVKILKDSASGFGNQVQIKSNPRVLPKSGSFPISRPARIEDKQKENWFAPKQSGSVLTLNVPKDTSQEDKPISLSHGLADDDHGFNHAVINGFREIKKLLKNALKDRNHTKKNRKKHSDVSKDDYVGRYSQLLEHSFKREGGELRSRSLKISHEEKRSDSRDNKPVFFRRVSSLSSLEVLGSFLTDLPQDSSTSRLERRQSVKQDTNYGSKKSSMLSESSIREDREQIDEKQEERSQANHLDSPKEVILRQGTDSVPSIGSLDDTEEKTETLLSQGLGLSSIEIYNHEEADEDVYFCYVKKVLEVSGFIDNKENETKWYSEEQPLNPSLLYEVDIQEETVNNKELLFDLVNDAIVETHNESQIYFPKIFPKRKCYLDQVWGRVEWSLNGLGAENRDRSLDDIVGRDLKNGDAWMNLQTESDWLTLDLEDLIFDDLLDDLLSVY